jgi:hypothetical protein
MKTLSLNLILVACLAVGAEVRAQVQPVPSPVTTAAPKATPVPLPKLVQTMMLGETSVNINIYEVAGSRVLFFAPHHNEQTGTRAARETIARRGGRIVEVESLDERGRPARRLKFTVKGAAYTVDPNRIFTENGRACSGIAGDAETAVKAFADSLLKVLFPPEGKTLGEGEKFIVALHNNSNADARDEAARLGDLTAYSFTRIGTELQLSHGNYKFQAEGVYFSNTESDADNFIFLTTPRFLGFFVERGFNVVVQAAPAKLNWKDCNIDDGSLSVYAGKNNIPYINLEADSETGAFRQGVMIDAIYLLHKQQ